MKRFLLNSERLLPQVADAVISKINSGVRMVIFTGEMGAGKTTLIKVICRGLGVSDAMSSPTFSIVNEYRDRANDPVYHFDFFRVKNNREALDIGVEEYFYSGHVCLVEWPEMINDLIPEKHLQISIKLVENNNREVMITGHD